MRVRTVLISGLLAASAFAGACASSENLGSPPSSVPPPAISPPGSVTCNAAKAQFAIGSTPSSALLEKARAAAEAGSARFLRYNEPITMEFLGSRLNLVLNARGVVDGAYCG